MSLIFIKKCPHLTHIGIDRSQRNIIQIVRQKVHRQMRFYLILAVSLQQSRPELYCTVFLNQEKVLSSQVSVSICRNIFAGFPATMVLGGTSLVTTDPEPTMAFSPTVMPHKSVALDPMDAPFLTNVGIHSQSASVCN